MQIRDTPAAKLESFVIVERVLREQFELVDDDNGDNQCKPTAVIRAPKDALCDNVGNPADSSFDTQKGDGYFAQIVEIYGEDDDGGDEGFGCAPDLITYVMVHKMTVHDAHRLPDMLDDLATRSLMPKSCWPILNMAAKAM